MSNYFVKNQKGQIIILALILPVIFISALVAMISWASSIKQSAVNSQTKDLAFEIAEAGANYYRWHLAHSPTDYYDGTGAPGTYVHNFFSKEDPVNAIGQFSLEITPPSIGSTIVAIKSSGYTLNKPNIKRIITIKVGKPSIAKYAWAIGDNVAFGATSEIFGPIHSNGGIQFNGIAHSLVSSSKECYDDPDNNWPKNCSPSSGPNDEKSGVWGTGQFLGGTAVGISAVSFLSIISDLNDIKLEADTPQGFYRGPSSPSLGYHITLKADDTFDLRTVTSLVAQGACYSPKWSIQGQSVAANSPFPANGLMFFEDNIWVDGIIDTARLTIASARFTADPSSITINNDITYAHTDGSEVLGLIAEKDINIGFNSEDDLRIDGALIAKNGRFGRPCYSNDYCWRSTPNPAKWVSSNCGANNLRTQLTTNGMIASSLRSAVYYCAYCNGYQNRQYNYDGNLYYGPPPSFPLTSDDYETISWEEVKN